MTEHEPPSLPHRLTEEEMRRYRLKNFERIVRKLTAEQLEQLQGRVFDDEDAAALEGYISVAREVPRETVFNELGPQLLQEHGSGNWGVTFPMKGEGEDVRMNREALDVWALEQETPARIIPGTSNVLRLVVQNPSEHDIDKK